MRVNEDPLLPLDADPGLRIALSKIVRDVSKKLNQLAAGTLAGFDNTATGVPTTGTWAQGDFVKKATPLEAGAPASKYVVTGWIRLTNGSANVLNTDWVEARILTGN